MKHCLAVLTEVEPRDQPGPVVQLGDLVQVPGNVSDQEQLPPVGQSDDLKVALQDSNLEAHQETLVNSVS